MPEIEEDCVRFDPNNLEVEQDENRYFLLDGSMPLIAFEKHEEAEMSKEVMLRYHLTSNVLSVAVMLPSSTFLPKVKLQQVKWATKIVWTSIPTTLL